RGAAAHAAHGQALQLVAAGEGEARVPDLHVLHGAGVVGGRVAAVHAEVAAFDARLALGGAGLEVTDAGVDRRAAGKDQATPAAVGFGVGIALDVDLRGHDDQLFGGAEGEDLRATVDHQRVGAGRGVQRDARLDVEDALAGTGTRRGCVAAHVFAHVHGAVDRVHRAGAPGYGQLADDAFGKLAGPAVGGAAYVAEALGSGLAR